MSSSLPYPAANFATVSKGQNNRPVGESRLDVHRSLDRDAVDGEFTDVGGLFTLRVIGELFAGHLDSSSIGIDTECSTETWADQNGVIP